MPMPAATPALTLEELLAFETVGTTGAVEEVEAVDDVDNVDNVVADGLEVVVDISKRNQTC